MEKIKKETYLTVKDGMIFEGMTSLSALITNALSSPQNARKIYKIYVDRDKVKSKQKEISFLVKNRDKCGYSIEYVSSETIDEYTTGTTHGGIIAFCGDKPLSSLPDTLPSQGFFVLLDGIEDPYNFGYSLRSLYAAGVDGVILPERNWMNVAGIVSKSSAGTSELLPMYQGSPLAAVDLFKSFGYTVVSAGIRDSVSMYDADLKKPVLLIVGGEKRGISSDILSRSDLVVRIEYGRAFRGSLSAASAATLLAYEVFRQNLKH